MIFQSDIEKTEREFSKCKESKKIIIKHLQEAEALHSELKILQDCKLNLNGP